MNKQEKLNEMYEKVRATGAVHTRVEFAERIGYSRSNVSRALNGDEKYLTSNLFSAVEKAFPDVFIPSDIVNDSTSEYGNVIPAYKKYPSTETFSSNDKDNLCALIDKNLERVEELYKLKDEIYELKDEILDWKRRYIKLESDFQQLVRQNLDYESEIKKLKEELHVSTPNDVLNVVEERKGA